MFKSQSSEVNGYLVDPSDVFQPIIKVSRDYGFWYEAHSTLQHKIYVITCLSLFGVFNLITVILPLFEVTDVKQSTDVIFMGLAAVSEAPKIIIFLFKRKRLLRLFNEMKRELTLDSDDEKEKCLISTEINYVRRFFRMTRFTFSLCCIFVNFIPIIATERRLVLRATYPYDYIHNDYTYAVTYLFQLLGMFYAIQWNCIIDTFPPCLLGCLTGFYITLGYNFSQLGWHRKMSKIAVDESNRLAKQQFNKLMRKYVNITRMAYEVQDIFTEIIFIQFCFGGLEICMVAFHISLLKLPEELTLIIFPTVLLISMLIQAGLPCYFGNEIIEKSKNLMQHLYNSNWIDLPLSLKKDIAIFMIRLQRPTSICAGGLFPLSLGTYSSILNFAYSFYMLLCSKNS